MHDPALSEILPQNISYHFTCIDFLINGVNPAFFPIKQVGRVVPGVSFRTKLPVSLPGVDA
jgi:hypothetical protein